jgi:hypothetical protein
MFPENQQIILKAKLKSKTKKSVKLLAPIWVSVTLMEKDIGIISQLYLLELKLNKVYLDLTHNIEKINCFLKEVILLWLKMLR